MQKHASSCTIPTMPTPTDSTPPHDRKGVLSVPAGSDPHRHSSRSRNASEPGELLLAGTTPSPHHPGLQGEASGTGRLGRGAGGEKQVIRDALAAEFERTKNSQLAQVAADEKDRQANISQIEPGSWVTVHWLLPYRDYGKKKQRAATISGEVKSVDLNRGQVSFVCNSRPDDDEIKLHHIEKDSLVDAPMDSITSVTL